MSINVVPFIILAIIQAVEFGAVLVNNGRSMRLNAGFKFLDIAIMWALIFWGIYPALG